MKKSLVLFIAVFVLSCSNSPLETSPESKNSKTEQVNSSKAKKSVEKEKSAKATYLCKVNGEDWNYSDAHGMIQPGMDKQGEITANFNFPDNKNKGMVLYYDYKTRQLKRVVFNPVELDHKGKMTLQLNNVDKSSLSGEVSFTKEGNGFRGGLSGTASFKSYQRRYDDGEKKEYVISDLKFENVAYMNTLDFDWMGKPISTK